MHQDASKMMMVVRDMLEEKKVDLDMVPELAMSLEDLMHVNLGPNEAFLATRVNGLWTVRDILTISPFDQEECLAIFSKLMKRGVLRDTKGGADPGAGATQGYGLR